jgi:hypothetical protein
MIRRMSIFPASARQYKNLAVELSNFLHERIENTSFRDKWSNRNFELLREFSETKGADCFPDPKTGERQFLWDFIAYVPERGILIAAESEFDKRRKEIEHDFEKLLYLRSPIKLMMCRMKSEADAEEIRLWLEDVAISTCKEYSPAEVFVVYCVWWSEPGGGNRDFAYNLQISGKPMHRAICTEKFERVHFDQAAI